MIGQHVDSPISSTSFRMFQPYTRLDGWLATCGGKIAQGIVYPPLGFQGHRRHPSDRVDIPPCSSQHHNHRAGLVTPTFSSPPSLTEDDIARSLSGTLLSCSVRTIQHEIDYHRTRTKLALHIVFEHPEVNILWAIPMHSGRQMTQRLYGQYYASLKAGVSFQIG